MFSLFWFYSVLTINSIVKQSFLHNSFFYFSFQIPTSYNRSVLLIWWLYSSNIIFPLENHALEFFAILEALTLQICLDEKTLVKEKVLLQSRDKKEAPNIPQHSSVNQASIVQKQTPPIFLIRARMGHWVLHKMLLQVGILRRLQLKKDRFHNSNTGLYVLKPTKSLSQFITWCNSVCSVRL